MKTQSILILFAAALACAQTAAPRWQEFSIGAPQKGRSVFHNNGIRAQQVPLKVVIARAYDVMESRIAGPDWLATERYNLTAMATKPADFRPLMQKELAARFHLAARKEKRDIPVFVLKSPKGALQSTSSGGTSVGAGSIDSAGNRTLDWTHTTMHQFAISLSDNCGRPVLDETGIDGNFDFTLKWKDGSGHALQTAVKEQLGLELVEDRRPVEVLVIDHIEKLTFAK